MSRWFPCLSRTLDSSRTDFILLPNVTDGPDDPYIVRGSCGLTYSLVRSSAHLESEGYASLPSWSKSYMPGSVGSLFNSEFRTL